MNSEQVRNKSMKNPTRPSNNPSDSLDGMDHWYFAYGSNLCVHQMRARVGSLFCSGTANADLCPRIVTLPNHRIDFSMREDNDQFYANLRTPGDGVMGVIYRCHERAFVQLDAFESGYDRRSMIVCDSANRTMEAMVYIASPETTSEPGAPTEEYLETILRGAEAHGLPVHYLKTIKAAARRSNHQTIWSDSQSDSTW